MSSMQPGSSDKQQQQNQKTPLRKGLFLRAVGSSDVRTTGVQNPAASPGQSHSSHGLLAQTKQSVLRVGNTAGAAAAGAGAPPAGLIRRASGSDIPTLRALAGNLSTTTSSQTGNRVYKLLAGSQEEDLGLPIVNSQQGDTFQHAFAPRGISARNKPFDGQLTISRRQEAAAKNHKDQQARLQQQQLQQEQQPPPSDPYDGEDVKQRIQQWFVLLRQMQANADSPEFVYLRHARPNALPFNPFDLQVASHSEVAQLPRYYTMSPKGVTHISHGEMEFLSLPQWEREYLMHSQLMKLNVFRQYRMWRTMAIWRKGVRGRKAAGSTANLGKRLCFLNPALRQALYGVRQCCSEFEQSSRPCLQPGQPVTLNEFAARYHDRLQEIEQLVQHVGAQALSHALKACKEDLDALVERMLHEAQEGQAHRRMSVSDQGGAAAFSTLEMLQGDSYALQAAKRSEKRQLLNFIKLLDFMVADGLHSVLMTDTKDILQALLQPPADVFGEGTSILKDRALGQGRDAGKAPVLQVEVLLDEQTHLVLHPSRVEFLDQLEGLQSDTTDAAKSLRRLLVAPELQEYMEYPTEGLHLDREGLLQVILGEAYNVLVEELAQALDNALGAAEQFMKGMERLRLMVKENSRVTLALLQQEVEAGKRGLGKIRADLLKYQLQLEEVKAMPAHRDVGILQLKLEHLKEVLIPSPTRCLAEIHKLLPRLAEQAYNTFISNVHNYASKLSATPTSPEEFVAHLQLLKQVEREHKAMDSEFDKVTSHYELMEEFNVHIPEVQLAAYQTMHIEFTCLRDAQWAAESAKERLAEVFRGQLAQRVEALQQQVQETKTEAQDPMILDGTQEAGTVIALVNALADTVHAHLDAAAQLAELQQVCGGESFNFELLEEVAADVELKQQLWISKEEWGETRVEWLATPFLGLDLPGMEEKVTRLARQIHRFERGLPPNKIAPDLRETVTQWQEILPVCAALHNAYLRERHWEHVADLLHNHINKSGSHTLDKVLQLQVLEHKDAICTISLEATQEAALEALLAKVADRWRGIEFVVKPYKDMKDVYTLGSLDEVLQALEDSKVTLSTILASRYVGGIRADVDRLDRQLRTFSATLDAWLQVQKGWVALEAVFNAADIQRQLPAEATAFALVDKTFKDIMRRTQDRPNALQCGTNAGWLDILSKCCITLESIQKALEDYYETKRLAFPRFYFLSNEELLDILSQSKNPHAVQPHLQKCFDGIRLLEFSPEERSIDVLALLSSEGEKLPLAKVTKARGLVECWLSSVEANMRLTLRTLTKKGVREYHEMPREQWILQQPAQLVIVVSNIYWCQSVEQCLNSSAPALELQQFHDQCVLGLIELTNLVHGPLTDLGRRAVVALITIDVHNRDIVESLAASGCSSTTDFNWQMQLRYEYDVDTDSALLRQVLSRFEYGYEYLGAQPRLVVTPMTDRCYLTLTGALHLKLGGAPAGPAGTGKTETVKDLGKAMGIQCVVFNCGENLDHRFMARFFRGLSQCGAWACFDEFNRIDVEVLSVVAQQLMALQSALRANSDRCLFEGREMRVVPTCGVFITMNPGYAGRTELPDNLKALFRPMAMMIPDYQLVAEVMLLSEGFNHAKTLSGKMVHLYKLASEQLSQQDHYDFGMRALKSVLVIAGVLKRSSPDVPEEAVLVRAMRDANLPKFLSQDAVLFEAIIGDLFPELSLSVVDHGLLERAVVTSCRVTGLQATPSFINKAVQLHETMVLRFGAMLVGPTGGGKSCCYQVLQSASGELHAQGLPGFKPVQTHVLNPKCISLGELYGAYNSTTNEWTDGLASSIIRAAVADEHQQWHWVVFDGPVDALWIESMNTVLDDNCLLCLPNGERIKLDPGRLRMLFEVQDLVAASPATVSRCGMVYVPSDVNGWRSYARSWLEQFLFRHQVQQQQDFTSSDGTGRPPQPSGGSRGARSAAGTQPAHTDGAAVPDALGFMWGLFEKFVDPLLSWLHANGKELIPQEDISRVTALTVLLESLVVRSRDFAVTATLSGGEQVYLQYLFAFSAVWGLGGALDDVCWPAWDQAVRAIFDGTANFPACAGTVFDYYVDERHAGFVPWSDAVPAFNYDPNASFASVLVPIINTVRYGKLLEACYSIGKGVMLFGASGVGKSAIIDAQLAAARSSGQLTVTFHCSARTTSPALRELMESKLVKRGPRYGAPNGHRFVLFVDDMNLPAKEMYGTQPALELLRVMMDRSGFHDPQRLAWKELEDVLVLSACGPSGGGRQEMSPRVTRPFVTLCVPQPSEACMRSICTSILQGFLDHYFTPDVRSHMLRPMAEGCVEIYKACCAELLPTPARSHYTFNFRDVSKVLQGLLSIRLDQCGMDVRGMLTWLFVHEHMRVFGDRLVYIEDVEWLQMKLCQFLKVKFDSKLDVEQLFHEKCMLFGDFHRLGTAREDRVYEELPELPKLAEVLETYLEDYNLSPSHIGGDGQIQLVFFRDAVDHVVRLARILRQPRGSALLVGVAGTGKQTIARFAAYVSEVMFRTVEHRRGYSILDFREDLKSAYNVAGVQGQPVVFMLTDSQITDEAFLGDINGLLNTGEITGLHTPDDVAKVLDDIRPWLAQQEDLAEGHEAAWSAFVSRARDNLHLIITMSPVGSAFGNRCRQFPSLISCTTTDWYSSWPKEALLSVSSRFMQSMGLERAQEDPIARMCVETHAVAEYMAERYWQEQRRRYYITPRMYLDFIKLYGSLHAAKGAELYGARDRLLGGIHKLQDTNAAVDKMQRQLNDLQPLLAEKTQATEKLLAQVQHEQEEAEAVANIVAAEEAEVAAQAAQTAALKDEAAADLAVVLPALEGAVKALDALNKADIIEMKTFTKPPALVQLTMEAVCTLLQEKTDWDAAKRVLGEAGFIKRLIEFDKDNISDRVARALKKAISDPSFTPELVGKQSRAAMSMCLWVQAMDTYATVYRIVEPKRQALAAAQAALEASNEVLRKKQAQLKEIYDKVKALQQQLQATRTELSSLQQQAELSQKRLGRAAKLTALLGDEVGRWEETTAQITKQLTMLVGDAFLGAACINYYGAFTGPYRAALLQSWQQQCVAMGIPYSPNFSLAATSSSAVELRDWEIQGLPSDPVCIDNGILVTKGHRWPLMIDPQSQANRWIRALEGNAGLRVLRSGDPNLLRALEACVRISSPVLLEGCTEVLDPGLETLLGKKTFMHGNRMLIRLGDNEVDYDPNFRFYMTSRLANPHFMPETCIQVNLINFTVTRKGLEDQLLAELVRQERPGLEEQRDQLVVSLAADKRQLKELEDKVLKLLKEASGNILDDEVVISTLNNAKATSGIIQIRVKEAEETELQINNAREEYRTPPAHASLLWFIIADLPALDPMYQYSLSYFCSLFKLCIKAAPMSDNLPARLEGLISTTTTFLYRMVCRGLFDAHKLVFSLLIALSIQRDAGLISSAEWDFFLRGSYNRSSSNDSSNGSTRTSSCRQTHGDNPAPDWLPEQTWQGLKALTAAAPAFAGLAPAVAANPGQWQPLILGSQVEMIGCTGGGTSDTGGMVEAGVMIGWSKAALNHMGQLWGAPTVLTAFQRLLLTKVLAEEALPAAFRELISNELGTSFLDPPASNLHQVFEDSSPSCPIIFIMSQGTDPTAALSHFAKSEGRAVGQGLHLISLGQGQGTVAEGIVHVAMKQGDWVCLQNCHLARSWMPRLEALVEELAAVAASGAKEGMQASTGGLKDGLSSLTGGGEPPQLHPNFRLWLTSMPAPYFPVPVLQTGVKVTLEPPKGVRANMLRTYGTLSEASLSACDAEGCGTDYRRLVFVTSFLHAVLQERRKFGSLGWNIPYEYSDADISCALRWSQMLILEAACGGHSSAAAAERHVKGRPSYAEFRSSGGGLLARSSGGGPLAKGSGGGLLAQAHMQPPPQPQQDHQRLHGAIGTGVPWPALLYIIGQITYGGRVTDENDRLLLTSIMQQHLQPRSLGNNVSLTPSGKYILPLDGDLSSYQSHLRGWPLVDEPELFGFHANANITFNRHEAARVIDAVLRVQPRLDIPGEDAASSSKSSTSGSEHGRARASRRSSSMQSDSTSQQVPPGGRISSSRARGASDPSCSSSGIDTGQQQAAAMSQFVAELIAMLPAALANSESSVLRNPFSPMAGGQVNPLGVILQQEIDRYNVLLAIVRNSLQEVAGALAGLVIMSAELEQCCLSIRNHQVPAAWSRHAYPSLKPLGSWVQDLAARVAFLRDWLTRGVPHSFWLPGFFFPQGFLTAVLQNHARSTKTPIDRLSFRFTVLSKTEGGAAVAAAASRGVYFHGLFLEAARWDSSAGLLVEPLPRVMFSPLPVIHLEPVDSLLEQRQQHPAMAEQEQPAAAAESSCDQQRGWYSCPLYKTSQRAGALSTRGTSMNFVMHLMLPTDPDTHSSFWVQQGVAALCAVDSV